MTNIRRTKRLAARVTPQEHAEITEFLTLAGLSLPDFILQAIRSGQFERCPHCGALMGQAKCPNNSAPYPNVKRRAKEWREYKEGDEFFLVADGKIHHWNEDDL